MLLKVVKMPNLAVVNVAGICVKYPVVWMSSVVHVANSGTPFLRGVVNNLMISQVDVVF